MEGLDNNFVNYGIRKDDLATIEALCMAEQLDFEWMKEEVEKYGPWGEIIVTTAGCTISSHCGPGCIGVLFLTK